LLLNWIYVAFQGRAGQTSGYFVGSKAAAASTSYFTNLDDLNNTSIIAGCFSYEV
jgi:hypothetical protein